MKQASRTRSRRRGRLIYAASETCADLLYASGFRAPDPFLWFSTPAGAGMVVSALEIGRAQREARHGVAVLGIHEAKRAWRMRRQRPQARDLIAGLARHTGIDTWHVPADFPLGLAQTLSARGLTLRPDATFFPERRRKSAAEIDQVRAGVAVAELGLDRGVTILRASQVQADGMLHWQGAILTAERLRGEIDAEIARAGGTASHTIVAPGPQGADPHESGHGPIHANVPIVIDIFPRIDRTGYCGDLTRTLVKGRAAAVVKRAFNAVRRAQRRAIQTVRAGIVAADVHRAAADVLAAAEFDTDARAVPPVGFFHGLGHGLGLEVHDAPGPRLHSTAKDTLETGNVITIEPGLYYPDWGGVRLEDVVAVTAAGCVNLTTAEIFLEIP